MRLAPRVHIVHQGTNALGIRVVGDRVIGSEDEVVRGIFQNLIHLCLCLLQGSRIELALTSQTSENRTIEQFGNLLSGQRLALELMVGDIDYTARIVQIVIERIFNRLF